MALDKEFGEIPGTVVFDAEQARKGYWLNQFCMSLMKAENRARFKADERAYRDCLEIGGVRPQPLLAGADRWRAGISVRSRCRACRYRRRCEPEAEDPPLAATSASAAICSSGGSPENWPSLR